MTRIAHPVGGRRRLRRALAIAAVNAAVLCALLELAGLVFHALRSGTFFYGNRPSYALLPETEAGRLTADGLNPYFGPSHKAGHPFDIPAELRADGAPPARLATNNFGFVSPYNFPIAAVDDEFLIGIFGGSVGVWFCHVGVDRLIEQLQRHAFFGGRRPVSLCMAHEGYKQPQQALVLAYFLSIGQTFHLVVNIDGFNEVALSPLNDKRGVDISMPSVSHLEPLVNLVDQATLTPDKLESLATISRLKRRLNWLAAVLNGNRLASIELMLGRYRAVIHDRYQEELRHFAGLPSASSEQSLINAIPATEQREGARLYGDIARQWADASILMRDMSSARGMRYLHVLQPNQYRTDRLFSPDEARVALDATSPYKPGVEQGYPALLAEAEARAMIGSGFLDASRIFDTEPEPVYVDNCCHYTRVGYRLLADAIAEAVVGMGPE